MKTTFKDIALDRAECRKYDNPDLSFITEPGSIISLTCPWCKAESKTFTALFPALGKDCKCGALLTDQGNAWKVETAKEPYETIGEI